MEILDPQLPADGWTPKQSIEASSVQLAKMEKEVLLNRADQARQAEAARVSAELSEVVRIREDKDFHRHALEIASVPDHSVVVGYRLEWRPGDYVYYTLEDYAKETKTQSARVCGLYKNPQPGCSTDIEVYRGWCWQRPGKLLYPSLKGFVPLYLGPIVHEPPAEKGPAIDLIGCALVAFKATVPLRNCPQVLLGKRNKAEGKDLWVLPGGKQDVNESPDECVRREIKEEVGVSRLVGLKPVSFSYNDESPTRKFLMLYYTAYVAGEEPKIVAHHEFSDLRWFDVDALPAEMWQSDRNAIASTLMMRPK